MDQPRLITSAIPFCKVYLYYGRWTCATSSTSARHMNPLHSHLTKGQTKPQPLDSNTPLLQVSITTNPPGNDCLRKRSIEVTMPLSYQERVIYQRVPIDAGNHASPEPDLPQRGKRARGA
uniref:Uncharacterized protein n=1 Tax=Steinernema glaseri TaxID=37863 RepID=A0A1I8AGS8_9BILA